LALPDIIDMIRWDRDRHGRSRYLGLSRPTRGGLSKPVSSMPPRATGSTAMNLVTGTSSAKALPRALRRFSSVADAIRRVFCDNAPPHEDIIPEDVGLDPPEKIYLKRREILGGFADRPREPKDGLLASYTFDNDDEFVAKDASACAFHALKNDFKPAAGRIGQGFLCQGGTISAPSHPLFFPRAGITVELWCRTDVAGQSDRWMLNTVGQSPPVIASDSPAAKSPGRYP
jgi:hypothetical protein